MSHTHTDTIGLRIHQMQMGYGQAQILRGLDTPLLPPGSVTALIGPNGAGKSTLLRGLAGLQAIRGEVWLDGHDLAALPISERTRHLVFLPQSLPSRSKLAVFESVLSAAMAGGRQGAVWSRTPDQAVYERIEDTLSRLQLDALADRTLDTLSGGQRQLVGLAQALVRRPRVLLLDEPTSALDLRHQYQVIDTLRQETRERQLITLIVLHDINLALAHADHVLVLHEGRLIRSGPPADVIDSALLAGVYGVHGDIIRTQGKHLVLVHGHLPHSAS